MTSLQKESGWEKAAEEDIIDKVQDCVYGMNINVGGKEYEEILRQIKGSIWLRGEIQRVLKESIANREKEIAEEVNKLEKEMPDRIDEEDVPGVTDQVIGFNKALEQVLKILKH